MQGIRYELVLNRIGDRNGNHTGEYSLAILCKKFVILCKRPVFGSNGFSKKDGCKRMFDEEGDIEELAEFASAKIDEPEAENYTLITCSEPQINLHNRKSGFILPAEVGELVRFREAYLSIIDGKKLREVVDEALIES